MEKNGIRPFGWRDKVGYLLGDFGNDFTFIMASSYLMKFYTDVMGVSAGVVGVIMMLARIVDAFTDIGMGRIADRSPVTANGKFKPWLKRMCIPVAFAGFLMYQAGFADWAMNAKIAYLAVTYLLWGSFCYTGINIPYGSMASAISADPSDRQSLSTFRTMGGMLAGMIIMIGVPLIAYTEDALGNSVMVGERITIAAGVFSVLAVICYLLCYKLVTERVVVENAAEEQPGLGEMISSAMGNRALISIIAAAILMLLSQLTMQGMANYVYPNYYGDPTAQSASSAMMAVGMVAAAAMAKPLGAKFGKAEVSAVCCAFATVMNILLFFVRPESVWVYAGFQMLSWLGLGVFQMVCWALITDVIDDTEVKTGRREDGTVYAIYSWARKLGQAASSGLMGWLLTLIGYTDATAFDPVVTEGIFDISVIVPVIGFGALALVLVFWYPLHKKAVDANVEFLNKKHGRA